MTKGQDALILLTEQFLRVMNKYMRLEMVPLRFSDNEAFNPSEIHTVDAIGKHDGINVTELARAMGITKGGVSQMVAKLVKKGLVAKTKDGQNDKEVRLRLTPDGLRAYRAHENLHAALNEDLLKSLDGIGSAEILHVRDILAKLEVYMDQYLEGAR